MNNEPSTQSESASEFVQLRTKHEPDIHSLTRASLPSPQDVSVVNLSVMTNPEIKLPLYKIINLLALARVPGV
jgi:hypothetical protein